MIRAFFILWLTLNAAAFTVETLVLDESFVSPLPSPVSTMCLDGTNVYIAGGDTNTGMYLLRLSQTGVVDQSFDVGTNQPTSWVRRLIVRDGKIYALADALYVYNLNGRLLARWTPLNIASAETFVVDPAGGVIYTTGEAGRFFDRYTYAFHGFVFRLHANGDPDETFTVDTIPWARFYHGLWGLALQQTDAGEKLLVVGRFSAINGQAGRCLARLNLDGSLDPTFQLEPFPILPGAFRLFLDRSQRIYCAADLGVQRVFRDGGSDSTFHWEHNELGKGWWPTYFVQGELVFEPDGHIMACRAGRNWAESVNSFARYDADGRRDRFFRVRPVREASVNSLLALPDGSIWFGGRFTYSGKERPNPYLGRLVRQRIEVPSPTVSVTRTRHRVVLSWPDYYEDYRLEGLRRPRRLDRWVEITNAPIQAEGRFWVTNSFSRFGTDYRLAPVGIE